MIADSYWVYLSVWNSVSTVSCWLGNNPDKSKSDEHVRRKYIPCSQGDDIAIHHKVRNHCFQPKCCFLLLLFLNDCHLHFGKQFLPAVYVDLQNYHSIFWDRFFCLYFALEVQASLTTTSLKSMYLYCEMEAGQHANCMESAQDCWFWMILIYYDMHVVRTK